MAKVKQIPFKQQVYEQILTKQLYGERPNREEGIAQLQATHKRQQGITQLQTDYDNWHKAQQPVQAEPTVETVKAEPVKVEPIKTEPIKAEPIKETAPKKAKTSKKEEKKYLTHADVIPSLTKKAVESQKDLTKATLKKKVETMGAPEESLTAYDDSKIDKKLTTKLQEKAAEDKRKGAQKKRNVWESFTAHLSKPLTDIVNAPVAIAGKLAGKDWSIYNDTQKQEFKETQEQHPVASTTGNLAGMALAAYALGGGSKGTQVAEGAVNSGQAFNALKDEAILNGATKGVATAHALKGAVPTLIGNAASKMPVDMAVDVIPTLANDIAEGEKNGLEIARDTAINTGINLGFNAIGDAVSLGKAMKNTSKPISADDAFRANINEGYDKLKAINEPDTVKLPDGKNVEQVSNEVSSMHGNVNKNPADFKLPEETFDKIDSYFEELARPLNKVQNSGIMNSVTDKKALTEWDNVNAAYSDYLNKAMFGDDVEEIGNAKKTFDNARKRFARSMKEMDPEISKEFNSGSFGYKIGKPLNERNIVTNSNQVQEALDAINELEAPIGEATKSATKPVIQSIDNAPRNLTVEEVNLKGGKKGYYVAENNGSISRNVENGKVYKTPEEAQEALGNFADTEKNFANANASRIPGADPLQTFADGKGTGNWKTAEFRSNTMEKTGWLKDENDLPMKDYARRVFTEEEQKAAAVERYKNSENVVNDLVYTDRFDAVDVKAAMNEIQKLLDDGSSEAMKQVRRLGTKTSQELTEGGQTLQAVAEYSRNTASGTIKSAFDLEEKDLNRWRSRNTKQSEGNSRIAKALSDMGNKWKESKETPILTHEQIKAGVKAELDKELGSASQYFNDNDLEYLAMLAEDKKVPVWQITDEIEHKLNFGDWYTLDESIPEKLPTNTKLNNVLNSLIEGNVRAEKPEPSLSQITDEVRNTINKEVSSFSEQFSDEDIDYLANLINSGATRNELARVLDMKLSKGTFGLSDNTLQEVNNIFKEISRYDVNSKKFVEGQAEAYRLLAEELAPKGTALEKFDSWRYMAMLGNPKTMLRNFIGNKMFGFVTGFSNNVAAIGEASVDRISKGFGGNGIRRTKAILNPVADSKLVKAASADAEESVYRQLQGSKYEKMSKDAIKQARGVWDSKVMRGIEKAVDKGISDYGSMKSKYSTSLAGYLKANGYDDSIFKAGNRFEALQRESKTRLLSQTENTELNNLREQAEALAKGREYALRQAEYATFHEDSAVANALSQFSKQARESDNLALKGMGYALEGTVPFKKTPINVLRSGVEYSPLGAIDSIRKTGKLIYENTGKRAGNLADVYTTKAGKEVSKTLAADVLESWSKTLTGTGLAMFGMYLFDKGVIHISNPDTKYQDQLEGIQEYSIDINGHTYTMDWAVPAFMPIYLGAEVAKINQQIGVPSEEGYKHIGDYMAVANRLAAPIVETSMLSGVKDTLETAASTAAYDDNASVLGTLAYNSLTGYATQAIPTLSGQIARTIDNTRRSTYSDKNDPYERTLDRQGKKILNKLPILSTTNEPYVDTYGREQKNSPFNNVGLNLAYQMLSPGYLADVNVTDADKLSREVYGYKKDESALPKYQTSFKDAEGNRVSPKDFTTASKAYGQANKEIREALAHNEWFNGLENGEKEEIVKGINTLSQHVGKSAIDPEYTTTSKAYNAYKEGGTESLIEQYKNESAKSKANESGFSSSSSASKMIQNDILDGNYEEAQKKVDAATQLANLGLDKPAPSYTYYNAQKIIPNLSADTFAKTYKSIDSDGNQGIKQDEIITYLNNHHFSESEGKKIWYAYGNSNWKYIPSLKDGKWSKSKK